MSRIESYYAASNYYDTIRQKQKQETEKTDRKKTNEAGQTKLSEKAQELLEKLRRTYGNMDFMVADFENGEDAKKILSRGTKEFSVLFSSEELEKMASDGEYEKECLDRIEGTVGMAEQINQEYGFLTASGKDTEQGEIARMGVSFQKDGTVTYFAELEKAFEEKKEKTKRVTVYASSMEELLEKIREIDWSRTEEEQTEGGRFDLSV